jgi:hypothetical protein
LEFRVVDLRLVCGDRSLQLTNQGMLRIVLLLCNHSFFGKLLESCEI